MTAVTVTLRRLLLGAQRPRPLMVSIDRARRRHLELAQRPRIYPGLTERGAKPVRATDPEAGPSAFATGAQHGRDLFAIAATRLPATRLTCSILVPTYRRPNDLSRCLAALAAQDVPADQVVVVVRADDLRGRAVVAEAASHLPITEIVSGRAGQVAALNAGVAALMCDITAITDDDTIPRRDWIYRLLQHFADPRIDGVGGRDRVIGATDGRHPVVGRVGWFGQRTGNHHRGVGPMRAVDVLKGANMAFRTTWLRQIGFDERLRGLGAQVHNDLNISLQIRGAGGHLVYDPEVVVDHYPAPRTAGDDRSSDDLLALANEAHNETLALIEFVRGPRGLVWLSRAILVGTRRHPGILAAIVLAPTGGWGVLRALLAGCRGRAAGIVTSRRVKHRRGGYGTDSSRRE